MGTAGDLQVETCLIENIFLAAATPWWMDPGHWWGVAQVVIGLGLVIFVHELGHFLVAKACGVKCEKFYVGFDAFEWKIGDRVIIPRALVKWVWGETEYGVGVIPLGGYVKMFGQDDNPANIEKEIERSKGANATDEDLYEPSGLVDRSKLHPRSFLAKTVPQRMAIISAGVVFNIIFAILLAAIAFRSGVNYDPPMIGSVTPGGPAWEAGMGECQVVRIGNEKIEGYYTFINMAEKIIFDGSEENATIEVEYIPTGETESKVVVMTPRQIGTETELPRLGVGRRMSLVVAPDEPTIMGRSSQNATTPILGRDKIVEANGVAVNSMGEFQTQLAKSYGQDITVTLERLPKGAKKDAMPERFTSTVTPDAVRRFGINCEWGPVAGVQAGSPAATAGFQKDDLIRSINGEVPTNLYALDLDVMRFMKSNDRQPLEFVVSRKGTDVTLSVTPQLPRRVTLIEGPEPIGFETLGLAIEATSIVNSVLPGSPAASAALQKGDEITSAQAILTAEQNADPVYTKAGRVRDYSQGINFSDTYQMAQMFPLGQEFEIKYKRENKVDSIRMSTVASDKYTMPTLGVRLTPFQEMYTSASWGEAFTLGTWQTWQDLTKVFKFLGKLIRGRISAKNLGGPGTIFVVATSEASQGTSRLLLFLVLLSANLAIINFLPIPVLDGGHMMFLAYEGLFRKPVTEKVQVVLTYVGFLALLTLMAFVIWQDVGRISKLF